MLTNVITAYYKGKELIIFHGVKPLADALTVECGYLYWFDSGNYELRTCDHPNYSCSGVGIYGDPGWHRLGDCGEKYIAAVIRWDFFR